MKTKIKMFLTALSCFVLCLVFGAALIMYTHPMEELSLDLSLAPQTDSPHPEDFDEKGWRVYTQEGDAITELTPDGVGGYLGAEPGQTFYFSRVMEEALDSPTIQLGTANRNFSVFLDGDLIYTDCPRQDNRIGHLYLPMNEWDREEPVTVTLPLNYQGKTLTIAQSSPEYSEAPSFDGENAVVTVYPCSVELYCGFSYESALIAESFSTAILAAAAFGAGVFLLAAFARKRDAGVFCIALTAFLWMISILTGTSFYGSYFGEQNYSLSGMSLLFTALTLLVFLTLKVGKFQKLLWAAIGIYGISLAVYITVTIFYPFTIHPLLSFLKGSLQEWIVCIITLAVLILGLIFWQKKSRFYRIFAPLATLMAAGYWIVLLLSDRQTFHQLCVSFQSGQITYVYYRLLHLVSAAALVTALVEAVRSWLNRHMEKRLLEQRSEMAVESYKNLRRQQEEVMMLRHDMSKHFQALREISSEKTVSAYLDELIEKNKKIRPVVHSGNEMLDIILNGKLNAAIDAGVKVEIVRASAPEHLSLSDADLCSLVMNMMDNAVTAAAVSGTDAPYIRLDVHEKSGFLALICENSANAQKEVEKRKKEVIPRHGLGLKIMRGIAERYEGTIDIEYGKDYYKVSVAVPLHQSEM